MNIFINLEKGCIYKRDRFIDMSLGFYFHKLPTTIDEFNHLDGNQDNLVAVMGTLKPCIEYYDYRRKLFSKYAFAEVFQENKLGKLCMRDFNARWFYANANKRSIFRRRKTITTDAQQYVFIGTAGEVPDIIDKYFNKTPVTVVGVNEQFSQTSDLQVVLLGYTNRF